MWDLLKFITAAEICNADTVYCHGGDNGCLCAEQVTEWFTGKLGYQYDPVMHGTASEWLSDLISISFNEPPKYFKKSMRSVQVAYPSCGACIMLCADPIFMVLQGSAGNFAMCSLDPLHCF